MVGKITATKKNRIDESQIYEEYRNKIRHIPKLSKETEYEYAVRYYENDDLDACKKLLESNLKFVVYIARQYHTPRLSIMDLIQEGNVAMMKTIKKFNPYMNTRFVTFSVAYIRSAMLDFVLKNSNAFRFSTKSQKKIFFNINSMLEDNQILTRGQSKKIAETLNVPVNDVIETHAKMYYGKNTGEWDENEIIFSSQDTLDLILEYEEEQQKIEKIEKLNAAMENIPERYADIVRRRWKEDPDNLKMIAEEQGCTFQRIGQIEKQALKLIKNSMMMMA